MREAKSLCPFSITSIPLKSEIKKRKYGEALTKHESEMKKVESWRKALTNVGNLSGWEPKHIANGHEAKCISEIVDAISSGLCAAFSSDNEDLIGLGARLQVLKSMMEMESNGVVMVGIWGLGGGGKTTLASSLYNQISTRFDGCCFVENIREKSSKHGLPKLQKTILSLVLKQNQIKVNRVEEGRRLIKSRFRGKKVLMVLDDVDHLDQLKVLAGSLDWFGEGSRIIITTRDDHLLNAHNVNARYNICLLNVEEAMKLFCKHAPRHGRPIEDYKRLSQDVISYADGHPLALKVLGSFLCDKDMSEWASALARLEHIPENDIVEKLKISYDGLKPLEKQLFLDIACFFRGEDKDWAMGILDACGFHPVVGVKVLIQKALITVSQDGSFEMHDLMQEMGHYIVRGENPKNPETHNRVWLREDVLKICAMDATTKNVKIEALKLVYNWSPIELLPSFLGNMKKLRWIYCYGHGYHATSFPREFQPMELCYLQFSASMLKQLWGGYKHLPNLKVLNLRRSENLIRTPDFDGLPCLERIILNHCTSLKEMHPSIGRHGSLIYLDMEYCMSLEIFPPIVRMKKLETLLLSGCDSLCKFPEIQTSMDNLVELSLGGSGIEIVPSSIGQYCTNLLSLDLSRCGSLRSIEGNFRLLKHLKRLNLNGCDQLKNIPTEGLFDEECRMGVLSLSSTSFKNLHRGAMNFLGFSQFLRRLTLAWCNLVDGDISSVLCELSNLQALDLSGNDFSQLHSSLLQLPRLKFLNLSNCKNLVKLPDLPSSIAILIAVGCSSLDIVGDFPGNHLKWLWKVSLSNIYGGNGKRLVQSLLQGNAIEDYFISLNLYGTKNSTSGFELGTFTLHLPQNWYNEFSGFLIQIDPDRDCRIRIKDVMERENAVDVSEGSGDIDEDEEREIEGKNSMCYISFGSLRHTSWWNPTRTTISFFVEKYTRFKVELVPKRRSKGELIEIAKDTTNSSEYWDTTTYRKTFELRYDSKSSIDISWWHDVHLYS